MPTIIIVAGPNGAGKTTFAKAYLRQHINSFTYINADDIARLLKTTANVEVQAARQMLVSIDASIARLENVMFETTLATRAYAHKIKAWRQQNYSIALIYLRLLSVGHSIERVARRVAVGGHNIPEAVIRRRFIKSLTYFDSIYKPIVDEWYVWNSLEGEFEPSEAWDMP